MAGILQRLRWYDTINCPPFAMTRWVAQTRQNYVSVTPYNHTDTTIHGFQGTHQPAIWMGESGQVVVVPGSGRVQSHFHDRGMVFDKSTEVITASYYSASLQTNDGGNIHAEQSASTCHDSPRSPLTNKKMSSLACRLSAILFQSTQAPYVLLEASRASVMGSADPNNVTYPLGSIYIDPEAKEITGTNAERQDFIIDPVSTPARGFKGYFCARFDRPFLSWGVIQNGTASFATFDPNDTTINVRVGVSFISIEQARRNLDNEIPDGTALEDTAMTTRAAWAEKMDRIQLEGATEDEKVIFYTGFYHTLQYPYETSEDGKYYSGYDDSVHEGVSYSGYSIWVSVSSSKVRSCDSYPTSVKRTRSAPNRRERVPGTITVCFKTTRRYVPQTACIDVRFNVTREAGYRCGRILLVGTHADSLIAEAVVKGITGFNLDLAWEAVLKDATIPPLFDREEVRYTIPFLVPNVQRKARMWITKSERVFPQSTTPKVGLLRTSIPRPPHVRSITLPRSAFQYLQRSYWIYGGSKRGWIVGGEDAGWTEGDKWAYSFDVVHDIPRLIPRGRERSFVQSLEEHFNGGHNDHTNEVCYGAVNQGHIHHSMQPSHHIPYLYALAGAASKTQERVRSIAKSDYGTSPTGLAAYVGSL
ncbi:glycoside hydrolase family protein [Salix suchowensis]|nr:glycoside hydrolase family protein [Salix suchowensis]